MPMTLPEQIPETLPTTPIPGLPSLHELQVLDMLARMPPEAILDAPLAAIYLRVSEQTLAKMRADKSGPQYSQGDSGARNAKVSYRMGDLRDWHRSKRISSTMEAAKRRGMCFSTLSDFTEPQPMWAKPDGGLVSHSLTSSVSDFNAKSRAGLEIVWMPMIEAMGLPWDDVATRREFLTAYLMALETEAGRARSAQDESELLAGVLPANG